MTPPLTWSVVVPVKLFATAKSRLRPVAPQRPDVLAGLALAFAADTVTAALAAPPVVQVVVVTDEPAAARLLAGLGAVVAPDTPGTGLNAALAHGAQIAAGRIPAAGRAALSADLPALRPPDLGAALAAAGGYPRAFVADTAGSGTTVLAAVPGVPLSPAFGPASADRHRRAGAAELRLTDVPGLRLDVDTPADLAAAVALGVGPHTAAAWSLLPGRQGRTA